jgi:hypothetical protein
MNMKGFEMAIQKKARNLEIGDVILNVGPISALDVDSDGIEAYISETGDWYAFRPDNLVWIDAEGSVPYTPQECIAISSDGRVFRLEDWFGGLIFAADQYSNDLTLSEITDQQEKVSTLQGILSTIQSN